MPDRSTLEETARRLALALSRKNMRPVELSELTGVSKGSISQYLNGSHAPSNISAGKMARVLDVNPLWLMGFDIPMVNNSEETEYYYIDEDARNYAEFLYKNPEYKVLFDASRKVKKEDIQFIKEMIDRMEGNNNDDTGC